MITQIWDFTSKNEIVARFMAKGMDRHLVQ